MTACFQYYTWLSFWRREFQEGQEEIADLFAESQLNTIEFFTFAENTTHECCHSMYSVLLPKPFEVSMYCAKGSTYVLSGFMLGVSILLAVCLVIAGILLILAIKILAASSNDDDGN